MRRSLSLSGIVLTYCMLPMLEPSLVIACATPSCVRTRGTDGNVGGPNARSGGSVSRPLEFEFHSCVRIHKPRKGGGGWSYSEKLLRDR
jgi:hypothetical protein